MNPVTKSVVEESRAQHDKFRLAVITSHPIQYFSPLYRRLAQEPAIDLTVYYCSQRGAVEYLDPGFGKRFSWDIPLLDGYHYIFSAGSAASRPDGRIPKFYQPGHYR
jgi:hypothetical protein